MEVENNSARQVTMTKFGSYVLITNNAELIVSYITVYTVAVLGRTFRSNSECICPFQFYRYNKNLGYSIIAFVNSLISDNESFGDCTWLAGTAFQTKIAEMFKNVLNNKSSNDMINKTTAMRPISSSIRM